MDVAISSKISSKAFYKSSFLLFFNKFVNFSLSANILKGYYDSLKQAL